MNFVVPIYSPVGRLRATFTAFVLPPLLLALGPAATAAAPIPFALPPASPAPSPVPKASPSPTPPGRLLGLHVVTSASMTLIGQNTAGGGQSAPEAAGFIAGSPLAPNTPYDLFSSAPEVPGFAGIGGLSSTATYGLRAFDLGLTAGLGYVRGSTMNASYWGESLMPTLNPHLGSGALPAEVAFPTHPGGDDATALRLSVLGGSLATADGNLRIRGGWFDLAQTDRFVFAQPPLTSVNPAIAYAPAETLSSGLAGADVWQPSATALPLQGVDVVAKRGIATLEASNAALPSLPGESARLTLGSLVFDRGEGTRLSAEILHVTTAGLPFLTTVPFGANPTFPFPNGIQPEFGVNPFPNTVGLPYPQGVLPASWLSGQQETIAGLRAAFHLAPALGIDGLAEVGRSWYAAAPVVRPGTEAPGGYYHLAFSRAVGRTTAALDLYRMEARYATAILPYGTPENQWSVAFAWPGQWLKSNYQLIDNSVLGVNRQGYRLRYSVDKGPLEVHLEYTNLRQISPESVETATQAGFVDGYFLPQLPDAVTFGRQQRLGFWAAWHPSFGDLTLDLIDDMLYRPFVAAHPEDQVAYDVPQAMLTYSRHISPAILGATGFGRYAAKGTFSEPIDFSQRLFFAGVTIRQSPRAALLATFRRTAFGGKTTFPASSLSPNFTGSALILEQRLQL